MPNVAEHIAKSMAEERRERMNFERDRSRSAKRLRYLAHADGYVMVRHPRCIPFVITEQEWRQLPYLGAT